MKKLFLFFALTVFITGQMWADDNYYVAHNEELGGIDWSPNAEIMTAKGDGTYYRTYTFVPGGTIAFKVTKGDWNNQLNWYAKDQSKSDETLSQGSDDNILFTTSSMKDITIWTDGTNVWVKTEDPVAFINPVLNGDKVMFYYGSPQNWGRNTMYFLTAQSNPENGYALAGYATESWKSGYRTAIGLYALNSSTTYYLSNNKTWGGNGKSGLTAGCFADMSDNVSYNTNFVCTLGSTSYAITEGAASVGITSTVSGKSGIELDYSLDHYYYSADGSTWSVLDPSDVSGLAVGSYTVKALATDGHIYLVSTNSATLTVSAYVPGAHDITATAATKWTYGSLPASETAGETVEFTVTPNDGYSVDVTSSDVAITKNGNTYSFTMPDNDVAITVTPTALSYNIAYPDSQEHYSLAAGNPTSGNTDATINITVTPDANYMLTVTANGDVLNGVNNVYSFTMPAEAVTIAVTAQALRAFDGSTPLYFNAAAVDWWCNDNAVQHATFVKADNSEEVVTGVVESGKIYTFTPTSGSYQSVKFSRHDPDNVSTDWGHTDYITLIGTDAYNYVSSFAQNSSTATWGTYVYTPPTIKLHGNFSGSWGDTEEFTLAGNEETASLTLSNVAAGNYEFGVKIDGNWTSNGSQFTSENNSHVITSGSGNCTFSTSLAGVFTFTWTYASNLLEITYPNPAAPAVSFDGLPTNVYYGQSVTFADYVTSVNVTQPEYTFYIKQKEGGSYGVAVTSKTFNDDVVYPCTYTVKAEVREEGAGGTALDEIEQDITIYEPITLYFVNKNDWTNLHAYAYLSSNTDIKNHDWAGEPMTDTDVDSNHGYDVYSITLPAGRYNTVIFNVGSSSSQTSNLTINAATPYYCDGAWFATLDAADPLNLASDFYLVGNIMGWDPTETYRFMKATEDATVASTTLTLNEYSNIDFKLKEGDAWRGAVDANVVLYHDYNTVQITENADGNNIGLTPYAAGDYIFTLDLASRELTVTYPDGDPMPIPTNIYLASAELNNWAPDNVDYKFTVSGDVASLALTLEAMSEYQFKLVYNGSWYGANYNFNYYWNTDVELVHEGDASHLYTFKAGTYTFEYTISTGKLSVRFQATTATSIAVSSYEYATLYSATGFDVPNEVEAYIITGIDGIHLTKERIYRIPANTGVILHAPEGSYDFYEGDSRYMGVDVSSNMLKGTTADQDIENELVHYVLSYDTDDNVGLFWPYGTGANQGVGLFNNKAGKAYLEIPAQAQSQGVIARRGFPFFPVADMPTGIESQELKVESGKMILNGQLLIIRDGRIFNAQGARVK